MMRGGVCVHGRHGGMSRQEPCLVSHLFPFASPTISYATCDCLAHHPSHGSLSRVVRADLAPNATSRLPPGLPAIQQGWAYSACFPWRFFCRRRDMRSATMHRSVRRRQRVAAVLCYVQAWGFEPGIATYEAMSWALPRLVSPRGPGWIVCLTLISRRRSLGLGPLVSFQDERRAPRLGRLAPQTEVHHED